MQNVSIVIFLTEANCYLVSWTRYKTEGGEKLEPIEEVTIEVNSYKQSKYFCFLFLLAILIDKSYAFR